LQTFFVSKKMFFKKYELIYILADVAQLVEQLICNQPVGGSSPFIGSKISWGDTKVANWGRL
jgi:hypothetical protein